MFVRIVVAILGVDREEGHNLVIPPGAILQLPDEIAAELVELGVAVPQRTDTPALDEQEQRTG